MIETELLQLLAKTKEPVNFCRDINFDKSNFGQEYLEELLGLPKLNPANELLLADLALRGLILEHKRFDTDQTRSFQITYQGLVYLASLERGPIARLGHETASEFRSLLPKKLADIIYAAGGFISGLVVEANTGLIEWILGAFL